MIQIKKPFFLNKKIRDFKCLSFGSNYNFFNNSKNINFLKHKSKFNNLI